MCSLCTDVPLPSEKIGGRDSSPIFSEGGGTSVHRLHLSLLPIFLEEGGTSVPQASESGM